MLHVASKSLAISAARMVDLHLDGCGREEALSVAACVRALRSSAPCSAMTDHELADLVARRAVARGMPVVLFDLGLRQR